MKRKFAPGQKVQYSDTNFQLLGKIIETITKKKIPTVFKEIIFDELQLKNTYLYEDANDMRPSEFITKKRNAPTDLYVIHRARRRHRLNSEGIYDFFEGIYQWTVLSKRVFRGAKRMEISPSTSNILLWCGNCQPTNIYKRL